MKFQKFHFMNGTMCATSSKKKMTAILLGLTLALAPYGMTSAEAAAKSGTEAAPAVTAVVPPTDAVAAKDAVNAGEEAKAVKDAAKGEAQASPVKEDVTIDARSSLDQSFDQLAEVKNGTYDMDLAASAPMGSTRSRISFGTPMLAADSRLIGRVAMELCVAREVTVGGRMYLSMRRTAGTPPAK